MNKTEDRDLLIALSLLPFLTPSRTRLLLEYFDPVETACAAPAGVLQGLLSVTREQADEVRNPKTRDAIALRDQVVTLIDAAYPKLLAEIIDPPLVLHVRGDVGLLARDGLAIVGSRRASPYAINVATHLANQLGPTGLVIVSGLARGVDAASHEAALDAASATIGVLGTGIDIIYPRSNTRLFRRMESQGLIVSEFPPGTPPKPEHFPIRNRIISGLTLGTVIVEATNKSGSLITARTAAEQGREVFAVPGSIFSRGSEGTHRLIQYGAKLVHEAQDVLDELRGDFHLAKMEKEEQPDSPLREVLEVFNREEGMHVDTAATRLRRGPGEVAEALLQLELGGWIRALPGARYVRLK